MAITQVWVSPGTGGSLDINTGGTISETWIDQLLGNMLVLSGTAGWGTVNASNGIQPASGYFEGAIAGNRHFEVGAISLAHDGGGASGAVTFANAFASAPKGGATSTAHANATYFSGASTTGATVGVAGGADAGSHDVNWWAEGAD